ncbi:HNH endonuclease [Hornefia butyriciproducens]|uniref:HNH endonuclease n=1 Tax=Hornefia butyriciproducens TaxID=2652293 RepID=UPI0023F437D4|nr:HNH endonuclease signature motif containing protein [Hornefia butyriciproducens]MCI7328050.1 HNH endonuclease [Clostridiales bacterium]MDD6298416.1 HNH endonuclease signature motif containing protein [Hornefia butyriciproducens]
MFLAGAIIFIGLIIVVKIIIEKKYMQLEVEVLKKLNFPNWNVVPYYDDCITVKSRQTLEKYDDIKYFKDNKEKLADAENIIIWKNEMATILRKFLKNNEYKAHSQYDRITKQINVVLTNANAYRILVKYISSAGNNLGEKEIVVNQSEINKFKDDPTLLMSNGEKSRYLKEQQKKALNKKQHEYYDKVNNIIGYVDKERNSLVIKGSQEQLDNLIAQLFDRTVNKIKNIRSIDSEEWDLIGNFMMQLESKIEEIISTNQRVLKYYESSDFMKIKKTCEGLMSSQREFNEYITEKLQSISKLFGTRVVRNETTNEDEYNYIRPYKKTITPFTATVSASVFSSAENNPLEYVVKKFYPNKKYYPEQIRNLYRLVEELETLRDAKQIIENYKTEYQQYLGDVPSFILENDETGFYSRLGFANIDESALTVEYKFSYTSSGGMAQRSFTVPMTEETIAELIKVLESKLTMSAFAKEQRTLMTKKLRESIKKRDDYTCCECGNSIYKEPNLLLEIDHIIPVSKGGPTVESNLQTLCWKCNRSKSNKITA